MILKSIRKILNDDQEYFRYSRDLILSHNARTLFSGCIVYAAVLAFYTVLTFLSGSPVSLKIMYLAFDGIHCVICIAVFAAKKKLSSDFTLTQTFSILLEVMILAFFALEGVFTSASTNTLYLPIAILMVLLLFIHKMQYSFLITFLYTASFIVLALLYKQPEAVHNDIYITLATFISANIGFVLIAQMRHNEAVALRNFEKISKTDELTGTLNKAALDAVCKRLIAQKRPFVFIIFDLDNFKRINDEYGHDVGDNVLRSVGETLRACFAEDDTIGRFGGDEFIVMVENEGDVRAVSQRVGAAIAQIGKTKFPQAGLCVKCSAGVAARRSCDDEQTLFTRADKALYGAKAKGKSEYEIAEE